MWTSGAIILNHRDIQTTILKQECALSVYRIQETGVTGAEQNGGARGGVAGENRAEPKSRSHKTIDFCALYSC